MNRGACRSDAWLWIAENTFREAVRQRLLLMLVITAAALGGSALFFHHRSFGAPEPEFLLDAGFGILTFFGSILAIVTTVQLFFSEIERRTVLTVLAKPVWRSEFILGKLSGVLLLLLAFCASGIVSLAVCFGGGRRRSRDRFRDLRKWLPDFLCRGDCRGNGAMAPVGRARGDHPFRGKLCAHQPVCAGFGFFCAGHLQSAELGLSVLSPGGLTLDQGCRETGWRHPARF